RNFTPADPNLIVSGGSSDITGVQWSANTYYAAQRNNAGTRLQVYITIDNFVSTFLLTSLAPINPFTNCCRGDMYKWNGAIYFTSGGAGGTAQLVRIR